MNINNNEIFNLYNLDTSEMSGAGGKNKSGRRSGKSGKGTSGKFFKSNSSSVKSGKSGKSQIKALTDKVMSIDSCDKALLGLYFVLLLLVLIMAGNLINNTNKASGLSWTLFTLSIFLGLGAMYCIYKGGKYKKYGLTLIALINGLLLLVSIVTSGSLSSARDKFSAHLANVLFVIVSILAAVITP
jgi:hypothetical protein